MPARMRRCLGCPTLTPIGTPRCPACASQLEVRRGSRHERGYGTEHYRIRADLLRHHMPGTPCPACGQGMWVSEGLDAGHSEDLRDNPDAKADRLEHRRCNRGWRARMMDS